VSAAEAIPAPDLGTWEDDAAQLEGETRHIVVAEVQRSILRSALRQEALLTRIAEAMESVATAPAQADPMAAARVALAAKRAAEKAARAGGE
jgi:hypothetical protein